MPVVMHRAPTLMGSAPGHERGRRSKTGTPLPLSVEAATRSPLVNSWSCGSSVITITYPGDAQLNTYGRSTQAAANRVPDRAPAKPRQADVGRLTRFDGPLSANSGRGGRRRNRVVVQERSSTSAFRSGWRIIPCRKESAIGQHSRSTARDANRGGRTRSAGRRGDRIGIAATDGDHGQLPGRRRTG